MLPFIGRFPVNSQIFAITISFKKEPVKLPAKSPVARIISDKIPSAFSLTHQLMRSHKDPIEDFRLLKTTTFRKTT